MSTEPESPRQPDGPAGPRDHDEGDSYEIREEEEFFRARVRRRDPRRLLVVLARAVRIVWRASRIGTSVTILLQVVLAGVAGAQVVIAGLAVRELVRDGDAAVGPKLVVVLVTLAAVTIIGGLVSTMSSQFGRVLGAEVSKRVTDDVLDVSTNVDLVVYDDAEFHDQLSRVITTMPTQPYAVVSALSTVLGGVFTTLTLVVTLAAVSPLLVVVLVLASVPLWWISRASARVEYGLVVGQSANARERQYVVDLLTRREFAAEARAYDTAATLRSRFALSYGEFLLALRQVVRRRYGLAALSAAAAAVSITATFALLALLIGRGSVGIAGATSAIVAIRLLSSSLGQLSAGATSLVQAALFLADFAAFEARAVHRRSGIDTSSPEDRGGRGIDRISFDRVCFAYPGTHQDAVTDLTFELKRGQVVAVVGENGSGKTTLVKILAGLYEADSGTVDWVAPSGRSIARRAATSRVTLVLQDFVKYQFSVLDNIVLGRTEDAVDESRASRAGELAGVDSFAAALPAGYATRLSRQFKGGRELSLGQWQRIALARGYYRDTDVVVLDEPASALDPRAEAQLFSAVRQLMDGRAVIMISHRLRSIRDADRILVMDAGRVVEDGTHAELMADGGRYAELVRIQERTGDHRA